MGILDTFPFPFDNPAAHELVRHLANMFTAYEDALPFAAKHGVDTLQIPRGLSPLNMWRAILREAAVAGVNRPLVQDARDSQPRNPRVEFLDAVLADQPALISAEPKGGASLPVSTKEALLFFDDLTIEVGRVEPLITSLRAVMTSAASVCRVRVKTSAGEFFGTGFRVGPDTILTNEHVLVPDKGAAQEVFVDFGFELDAKGGLAAATTLKGDLATIKADAADDWGVIKVAGMKQEWPILRLDAALAPKKNESAYILQHPAGQTKRLGFVRNLITDVTDRAIEYLTDTQSGSSGSPVFDSAGRVIGLHYLGGEPVAIPGKGPVSKNEGIRISRVVAGLAAKNVVL